MVVDNGVGLDVNIVDNADLKHKLYLNKKTLNNFLKKNKDALDLRTVFKESFEEKNIKQKINEISIVELLFTSEKNILMVGFKLFFLFLKFSKFF